jgi:hypothetical protein
MGRLIRAIRRMVAGLDQARPATPEVNSLPAQVDPAPKGSCNAATRTAELDAELVRNLCRVKYRLEQVEPNDELLRLRV